MQGLDPLYLMGGFSWSKCDWLQERVKLMDAGGAFKSSVDVSASEGSIGGPKSMGTESGHHGFWPTVRNTGTTDRGERTIEGGASRSVQTPALPSCPSLPH